jgi:hypothetical protein
MIRTIFFRATFVATFLFSLGGCENRELLPENEREILFSEYSPGYSCQWANLKYDGKDAILINSKDELGKYAACTGDDISEIDFSTHSLIIASGGATSGITAISKQLKEVESNTYKFDMDITLNMTAEAPRWVAAILIPAIPQDAAISLNINQHH